jgi:TonB-linked SusC/RagA family outer membrane protein
LLKDNEAKKYLFKTNIRQNAFDGKLELDYNFITGIRNYKPANYDLFYQAFIQNPTQPVYDPTNITHGGYSSLPGIEYFNPVAMLNERDRNGKSNDLGQNVRATLNLLPGLKFINFISYEGSNWEETTYYTKYYPSRIGRDGEASIEKGETHDIQYESTLNYLKSFNLHNIQAVAGYTYQKYGFSNSYIANSGFDTDIFGPFNIGDGSALGEGQGSMNSEKETNTLISFFGRVMYNYDGKYLASASLRREGSSRFGKNNKWGSFPALSLGWRLNKESFLENVSWINDLKLRLGYGVTGNQDFPNYQSLWLFNAFGKFLYNNQWINSYQAVQNPNPGLKWERKKELDFGVDFSLFGNRLGGSIDYYYRTSVDLLYTYEVPVPPYTFRYLYTNVGTIANQGVELTLSGQPIKTSRFQWNTIFTFSKNINKLIKFSNDEFNVEYTEIGWLGGSIPQYSQIISEGESLGNFYGMEWIGVDENGNDKFGNLNVVGYPVPKVIGNAYPFCSIGWSNAFSYRKWSLNMSLRSNIGGKVLNMYRAYYENWQTLGLRNIVHTQLENPEFKGTATYSSKYVEDASFLKLDNISISYNPDIKIKYVRSFQLSLIAQDVLCITGYKGLDPEVKLSGLEPGIESLRYYPRTTSVSLGLNIGF